VLLQEVEAAIAALPGVAQAVTAIVHSPTTQQDHLAAWVSPASLNPKDLLAHLAGSLPVYMIPTVIVPLAALPLLPSEKVNRKALPAPDWSKHMVAAAAAAGASKPASRHCC
jgi:acyl-CoA synthetase (AMP-forming)/AMP-acid ligase II